MGFDSEMVELFMEPAMELLEKMREALLRQDSNDTFLVQTMNNDDESNSILYYFKACNPKFTRGAPRVRTTSSEPG